MTNFFFCRLPHNRFPRLETGENNSEWDILRTWYLEGYNSKAWRSGFLIAQPIYQHWRQHPYRSIFVGTLLYHRIMNHWCFASLHQIAETGYIKRYAIVDTLTYSITKFYQFMNVENCSAEVQPDSGKQVRKSMHVLGIDHFIVVWTQGRNHAHFTKLLWG